MAEEHSRRLLKLFGVTFANFEARGKKIVDELREPMKKDEILTRISELVRLREDLDRRWLDVTKEMVEMQNKVFSNVAEAVDKTKKQE